MNDSQMLKTGEEYCQTHLQIENVRKQFGDVVAVNDVSFGVPKGEFFSLLGPSGCGKTTTLRMIGGFEFPDSGVIRISGRPMGFLPPYQRPSNMVFQQLALFPHMTVFENIAFGLQMKRIPHSQIAGEVNRVMALIQLEGYCNRRIHELSGGQQQRVAIARAIINNPEVLLLDEPLGALDLKLRLQMQIELKKLQREVNTTFVYVTHDQREAMTMSDRIGVMNEGCLVQIGTPKEIYERPANQFVAGFIGDTNLMEGTVVSLTADGAIKTRVNDLVFVSTNYASLPKENERVLISLRYENIRLGDTARNLSNVAEATIRGCIYRGSVVEYELQLEGGIVIKAEDAAVKPMMGIGNAVQVGWDERAAVVLKGQ